MCNTNANANVGVDEVERHCISVDREFAHGWLRVRVCVRVRMRPCERASASASASPADACMLTMSCSQTMAKMSREACSTIRIPSLLTTRTTNDCTGAVLVEVTFNSDRLYLKHDGVIKMRATLARQHTCQGVAGWLPIREGADGVP